MSLLATRFWDWAVGTYTAEGVAEGCLRLQDHHTQCVPLLLFGLWASGEGVKIDEDLALEASDIARSWSEHIISPLRSIRRTLKGPISDMSEVPKGLIREQVKALELKSERELMGALSELIAPMIGNTKTLGPILSVAQHNIVTLSKAWGPIIPRSQLFSLSEALSQSGFLRYTHIND
jgi:uncharacterized protein (TIGR02444 family)